MTYPQSGSGYGQGDAGQSAYGQQQYSQQQYGQQAGYGQQYGQQAGYGQQQQYGQQQYGQQYGYQAPKPPSQGLPANTSTILAAVIGALGVITLFCGFVPGIGSDPVETGYGEVGGATFKLFSTPFATPWALLAVAGVIAALTFLIGTEKWVTGVITALTSVSALVTIFMFTEADGIKAGAIILLVTSILSFVASVVWLLIETGHIKTAPAVAAAQAAAAPAADASAYGAYGQQAQAQQTPTYGQQAQSTYQPGEAYGQQAASGYQQPTSSPSNPLPSTPADPGATTAFPKPEGQ